MRQRYVKHKRIEKDLQILSIKSYNSKKNRIMNILINKQRNFIGIKMSIYQKSINPLIILNWCAPNQGASKDINQK